VVVCSNLGLCEIRFLFAKIIFWHGWEEVENPSRLEEQLEGLENHHKIVIEWWIIGS